jgi:hypothetical protein
MPAPHRVPLLGHVIAFVCGALACGCGSVEPYGPWPTTLATGGGEDDEGCAPTDTGTPSTATGADTSGTAGTSDAMPPSCDESTTEVECIEGTEGCPCTIGGACDAPFVCLSEVCVLDCPIGAAGCPCTDGGGCDPNLMCVDAICE